LEKLCLRQETFHWNLGLQTCGSDTRQLIPKQLRCQVLRIFCAKRKKLTVVNLLKLSFNSRILLSKHSTRIHSEKCCQDCWQGYVSVVWG